ncbi:MAG: hypothetical protein ACI4HQ_10395 [Acetatifactor sp.]
MGMNNTLEELLNAELILVGLGEDFDDNKRLQNYETYKKGKIILQEQGYLSLIPAWKEYCTGKMPDIITPALKKLEKLLEGKNYYIVCTSTSKYITEVSWKNNRLVMPCGTTSMKQCGSLCDSGLSELTEEDKWKLHIFFESLEAGAVSSDSNMSLGNCTKCGAGLELNNIYVEKYNENGYLTKWAEYTKWLQGTLNHSLLALELGVGMQFPSVIRWPFEKIVYFNKKAFLVRVHETLYQLTEELSGKGCGISQNAIEWLTNL